MADAKVTALPEETAVDEDDILYMVDDPGGTPTSKKATADNVTKSMRAYGTIYVADGSTAQTGVGTSNTLLTGFAADGLSLNTTPDHTNDQVTIDKTGIYRVEAQFSFSGSVSVTFEIHVAVDGVEQWLGCHRRMNSGGDQGSCSFVGILSLTAAEVITILVNASGANRSLTLIDASLVVERIG